MTKLYSPNFLFRLILIILIFAVYFHVSQADFLIGWDDQWFVTNSYTEGGLSFHNLYRIFTDFYRGQYAPLNQLYYTLLYTLDGYNPVVFHVASVLLHTINVWLVYCLVHQLSGKLLPDGSLDRRKQVAFFTAILFAVLPIHVESVAWVSASKVLLYALFYLAALISYGSYLASGKATSYYLTLLFFACSFGSKEQAVTLPCCLLLLDLLYGRGFRHRTLWLEKIPFLVLALLFGIATIQSQQIEERSFYPLLQRVPLAAYTFIEYFTKCLLPVNLSYLYPFPFLEGDGVPLWMWVYPPALSLIIYCFYQQLRTTTWLLSGLFFFLLQVILVINLFPLARFSVIADRYAYLAAIGPCFILARLMVGWMGRPALRRLVYSVGIVYVLALACYSQQYSKAWKNASSVKHRLKETIQHRPDYNELKKLR